MNAIMNPTAEIDEHFAANDWQAINSGLASLQDNSPIPASFPLESLVEDLSLFRIYFDSGSPEVRHQQAVLDRAVRAIALVPGCRVDVTGHTDRHGDREDNYKLGGQRALEVAKRLIDAKVCARYLDLISYGPDMPRLAADPDTTDTMNRRVEIVIRQHGAF